jgi:hypothetical protein
MLLVEQHPTQHQDVLRTERDANANLARALSHETGQYSVKPGGSEQLRDRRKGQHQNGIELRMRPDGTELKGSASECAKKDRPDQDLLCPPCFPPQPNRA